MGKACTRARRSCAMNAGTFEYHQWPMGSTLGKIHEYATSSAAASGASVETGKFTPAK